MDSCLRLEESITAWLAMDRSLVCCDSDNLVLDYLQMVCVRHYWCPCGAGIFKSWPYYRFLGVNDCFLIFPHDFPVSALYILRIL